MDNQKVLNMLSEIEEYLYYKMLNPGEMKYTDIAETYNSINNALIEWHRITGLKITN